MTTGVWVLIITCAACCSLSVALWWMERKKKPMRSPTKEKCDVVPVYVTAAIRTRLDEADRWKELALALEQLHIHIANGTPVPDRLRVNIREWKHELGVGQWEG